MREYVRFLSKDYMLTMKLKIELPIRNELLSTEVNNMAHSNFLPCERRRNSVSRLGKKTEFMSNSSLVMRKSKI